jgi:hypothetical protein
MRGVATKDVVFPNNKRILPSLVNKVFNVIISANASSSTNKDVSCSQEVHTSIGLKDPT